MDDDEHVRVRERFEDLLRLMLCQRFVENAVDCCEHAKRELEAAKHRLVDAQEYLARTIVTMRQAAQIAGIHSDTYNIIDSTGRR